jgi:hypothetical protein
VEVKYILLAVEQVVSKQELMLAVERAVAAQAIQQV